MDQFYIYMEYFIKIHEETAKIMLSHFHIDLFILQCYFQNKTTFIL